MTKTRIETDSFGPIKVAADRYLHVRMMTDIPSTGRRYPQIMVTNVPLLDDPVADPRAGALVVLLVRDPEQDHGANAGGDEAVDLHAELVDRPAAHRRQCLVRLGRRPDEEG